MRGRGSRFAANTPGDRPDALPAPAASGGGALWRLGQEGRQLDASLVRLTAGAEVGAFVEPHLDVLLYVADGSGELTTDGGVQRLEPGSVVWLPRGTRRALAAGDQGLVHLSAHRRRPGLGIGSASAEGGEAPCLLDRVCPACGRLATENDARFCGRCGDRLPTD
ncbi:AraC family ligand binding domain-containing protein [Streptomyces albidochromogenes]|uniref:AraC family ligand binding domain-containing protein n=1 Tax=Streptomyces albidochromogenes TaxID=329524 RepID=A0ABW6FRK6_9ACTN